MSLVHTLEWLLLFGGLAALGFLCSARMGEGFPAKRLLRRAAVALVFWSVLYSFSWTTARATIAYQVHVLLEFVGVRSSVIGPDIRTMDGFHTIDTGCMYACLWCLVIPFLWLGKNFWLDVLRIVAAAVIIYIVNLGRIVGAISAEDAGVSTFWAHDVVDYLLYSGTVLACFWWCTLQLQTREWSAHVEGSESRSSCSPTAPSLHAECRGRNCKVRFNVNL